VVIKENEFGSNYLEELWIKERLGKENPEVPVEEEDDPSILIGDTIIVDDGREPRNEEESLSPLSSPLSEIQDLFEGLRVDESGDTRPPESRQNASKKKGKSGA